jgi:hypothetical protein
MTEIEIATEIETGIGMEIEIAGTTTTGSITITTGTEMTDESIAIEMTADITAAMTTIVVMTATTGAGTEDAGAIGMAATGFTKIGVSSF